jgi:CRP/FNR family transcriptional regulator, nitrogen oxide reductase regulator
MRNALENGRSLRSGPEFAPAEKADSWASKERRSVVLSTVVEHLQPRMLQGLTQSQVQEILGIATVRRVSANTIVARQGDPADHLFLIAKGCARHFFITPQGQKIILIWLGHGEIFGGYALLPAGEYLVGTEMVKDSSLYVWSRPKMHDLMKRFPQLEHNALLLASDYLAWFLSAHIALLCETARERLAHILVSLALGIGHRERGGLELEITNEQLANAANITVFTTSRLLSEWQRSGAIAKTRGKVLLRSPEKLFSDFR